MRAFVSRFGSVFLYAGLFSFFINLLLLVPSLYMLQVFDRVIASRSNETLVMLTLAALVALVAMGLLERVRSRLLAAAGVMLDRHLGPAVIRELLANSARLGGTEYTHGLRDIAVLRGFLAGSGIFALFDAPWLPFYLLIIFLFHPMLGVIATCGALLLIVLAFINERLSRDPLEVLHASMRKAARYIDSSLRNAEVIGALGMGAALTRRWERHNDEVLVQQARASQRVALVSGLTKFTRQSLQVAMLAAGAYLVIDLNVTPGVMIAATILLGRALQPVETLIAGWKNLVEARAAYARLDALLPANASVEKSGPPLPAPLGQLNAQKLVFAPLGMDKAIVRGLSLALEAGESLAIVGPSASGKSTLARLLVGVWRPTAGTVRLDGADVASWTREHLGPHIGYLPQDVELFSGSVAENIARLGEATSGTVIEAGKRAHAHELILRLPAGYETEIGDGGCALSGGQRQRIGLARALFGNPKLVVLDEPNANLDGEGEAALMETLADLKRSGVTCIVITHRPSLLAGVDKVLVMREGTVEHFGPYAEVIARVTRSGPPPRVVVSQGAGV